MKKRRCIENEKCSNNHWYCCGDCREFLTCDTENVCTGGRCASETPEMKELAKLRNY